MVLDGFVRALDRFEAVLTGVAPSRWSAPSPCAGWSAADVAGHVIGDLRATEAMAHGSYAESDADDPGSAAGDDPLAAWRVARADMMAALDQVALARLVPGPWGQMPLGELLERSGMEFLVHAWDFAQATGQGLTVDDGLSRYVLDLAGQIITPAGRERGLFAGPVQAGPDAGLLDRLIAFTGRSVSSAH